MNGYRILLVCKNSEPAKAEFTLPGDLNAIAFFREVIAEHKADIIGAYLFRFNAGQWQHMMRKA